ncbi:type I 3-dehydroquinate dehydratase [Streptomyces sp. NBC_01373]|uniref:type I 3-dehydroquinate dehydratase n=1 Tax=unclassified Streptomyces TaxID=2593676 RepID=UPI002255BE40|nr:type I 3-dehydroquinate dehydratase [Streptomyces sp. NBC_01373]MCX4702631.1 type I 3-dehydroquinate dehydratase [Streptomyces sp. NBC_01373]
MELTEGSGGRPGAVRRARLVAVATEPDDLSNARLRSLDGVADSLEVRADLLGDPDPAQLRKHFTGTLTYCLRTRAQGGGRGLVPAERFTRLLRAADHYDVVDLEWPDDPARPELLAAVPPRRRRISWHGPLPAGRGTDGHAALREQFASLRTVPAALYLLDVDARSPTPTPQPQPQPQPQYADEYGITAAPSLLAGLGRGDVTAFASGPAGSWTRILAPWLGAPVVFGRVSAPGPDGMPSVGQLVTDYGLPELPRLRGLFGIAGRNSGRSLSPRLHNAALRTLGLPALYLPFQVEALAPFWRAAVRFGEESGLPVRGLTVTAPHKETALALADRASPTALQCGAANLLWREEGLWRADTTDTVGALQSLARAGIDPAGLRAAVVGCGGAGRAVAVALLRAGAQVTLVNRCDARGRDSARRMGVRFVPLSGFSAAGYGVLVQATPLVERPPFPVASADPEATVLEMAYRDPPTPLMEAARARGLLGIDGWEVLLVEVREQFRLLTGHPMPPAVLRALYAGRARAPAVGPPGQNGPDAFHGPADGLRLAPGV